MIKIMKKLIVYTLYYIGHFISLLFKLKMNFLYPIYNWCMIKSSELQDKWNLNNPWKNVPQIKDIILTDWGLATIQKIQDNTVYYYRTAENLQSWEREGLCRLDLVKEVKNNELFQWLELYPIDLDPKNIQLEYERILRDNNITL